MTHEDQLADAFQNCLARISAGESPEEVLAQYPALRAELRPALVAAMTVRHQRPVPAPAFNEQLLAQLDEAMAGLYPPRAALPWWAVWRSPRFSLRLAASMAAIFIAFTSLTVASANSRPGDLLYPVHTLILRLGAVGRALVPGLGEASTAVDRADTSAPAVEAGSPTPLATAVLRQSSVAGAAPADGDGASSELSVSQSRSTRAATTLGARVQIATAVMFPLGSPTPSATGTRHVVVLALTNVPTVEAATATPLPTDPPPPPTEEPTEKPVHATATPSPTSDAQPGVIAGRITEQGGRPAAGARVIVKAVDDHPGPPGRSGGPPKPREVFADADGRYQVDGLLPGDYKVSADDDHPGGRRWFPNSPDERGAAPVTVRPGGTTDGIDIRLERGGGGGPRGQEEPRPSATPVLPSPTATDPWIDPTPTPAD